MRRASDVRERDDVRKRWVGLSPVGRESKMDTVHAEVDAAFGGCSMISMDQCSGEVEECCLTRKPEHRPSKSEMDVVVTGCRCELT